MKTLLIILLPIIIICFSSCNESINENILVPDVNTDLSNSFRIQIRTNADTGISEAQLVDVSSSSNYNDFKNNIGGFEINKIVFKIKNYNAPEGLHLSGTLICSNEEETESYAVGSFNQANLSLLVADSIENTNMQLKDKGDKVIAWLAAPGRFKARSDYTFTNADGTPFVINRQDLGSNFVLVVTFQLTVKTKIK